MKTVRFILPALLLAFAANLAQAQSKEPDRDRNTGPFGVASPTNSAHSKFPRVSAIERANRQRRAEEQAYAERNPRMPINKPLPK